MRKRAVRAPIVTYDLPRAPRTWARTLSWYNCQLSHTERMSGEGHTILTLDIRVDLCTDMLLSLRELADGSRSCIDWLSHLRVSCAKLDWDLGAR